MGKTSWDFLGVSLPPFEGDFLGFPTDEVLPVGPGCAWDSLGDSQLCDVGPGGWELW